MGYYTSYQSGITGAIFCDQTATVCTTFTDPEHRTLCHELRMIDCNGGDCPTAVINNGLIICTEDSGWNCNLCANDLPYNSPVSVDDVLTFQFQQIDNINNWTAPTYGWGTGGCDVFLKDCCTGDYLEASPGVPRSLVSYCAEYFVGRYATVDGPIANLNDYQGIRIPLDVLYTDFKAQFPNSDCFYLEFTFDLSGTTETLYTETYEFINSCKNTILIRSEYNGRDCDGYWYWKPFTKFGLTYVLGTWFYYQNEIRIPAYLERSNFQINKSFVGNTNKSTSSILTENWRLATERIPEKVALIIAKILAGKKIFIGNGEFTATGAIEKNNEVGNQWFLEAELSRVNCSKSFSCNY